MAGSTGLEPAASGVTGRRSNQLNYDPKQCWIARRDAERRPNRTSVARSGSLRLRKNRFGGSSSCLERTGRVGVGSPGVPEVVGGEGLEPPTADV